MRVEIMKMDVHGFWSPIWQSARILIILACFASAQAGSLQEAVIRDGCSKYLDPKTILLSNPLGDPPAVPGRQQ